MFLVYHRPRVPDLRTFPGVNAYFIRQYYSTRCGVVVYTVHCSYLCLGARWHHRFISYSIGTGCVSELFDKKSFQKLLQQSNSSETPYNISYSIDKRHFTMLTIYNTHFISNYNLRVYVSIDYYLSNGLHYTACYG